MQYPPTNTTCTGVSHTPSWQKTFPLPSLSHARPNHPPVSRRTIQSLRPYLFPAPRTPELHHPPMMDSRPQFGHRHATANAVVFTNVPNKETVSNSNCTIPFGHPPEPETTRFSETNFHNEKARQRPAKRNLRPAITIHQSLITNHYSLFTVEKTNLCCPISISNPLKIKKKIKANQRALFCQTATREQ